MAGQICWLSAFGRNGEKVLHLRSHPHQPWQPYTVRPEAIPDYRIANGSKGWATYQKLLREGWTLVPTAEATQTSTQIDQYKSA